MPKYAYLFKDGAQDKQYLFVDDLASGQSSSVQLVRDVQTGELFVRKVLKNQIPGPLPPPVPTNEVEIIHRLRSFTLDSRLSSPKFAHLISSHDVPLRRDTNSEGFRDRGIKYARVSYWKLYNGGTLAQLLKRNFPWIRKRRQSPVPYALVARFIRQTCEALQLMYYGSKEHIIFHRDLHGGNMFIHWENALDSSSEDDDLMLPDFYIGDFENGEAVALSQGDCLRYPRDIDFVSLLVVILGLAERAGLDLSDGKFEAKDGDERGAMIRDLVVWMADTNEEYMTWRAWSMPSNPAGLTTRTAEEVRIASPLRPLDLSEVICRATELERLFTAPGRLDERGTETYRRFCRRGRDKARTLVAKEPYFIELTMDQSELGSWRMARTDALGGSFDIPSPWYVARLLEGDEAEKDGAVEGDGQAGPKRYLCRIIGDERGYFQQGTSLSGVKG